MSELTGMTCVACQVGAPKVTPEEKIEFGKHVPSWELLELEGVERLKRVFKLKNYQDSLAFTNQIAEMAEKEDHHPLIVLEWGRVTVEWWTHKIKGLHKNDYISAAKTDEIFGQF